MIWAILNKPHLVFTDPDRVNGIGETPLEPGAVWVALSCLPIPKFIGILLAARDDKKKAYISTCFEEHALVRVLAIFWAARAGE